MTTVAEDAMEMYEVVRCARQEEQVELGELTHIHRRRQGPLGKAAQAAPPGKKEPTQSINAYKPPGKVGHARPRRTGCPGLSGGLRQEKRRGWAAHNHITQPPKGLGV